jgi:DNA-binding beta-propeller fold protein YncE
VRSQAKAASAGSTKGRSSRRVRLAGLLAVLLVLLCAASAQAAPPYAASGEFAKGGFNAPTKIAVENATGNVFVVDAGNNVVRVFDSAGSAAVQIAEFGSGELSSPYGIAVDQSNGNVYVTDRGNSRIVRYRSDGAQPPTYTLDAGYAGPAAGPEAEAGQVGSFASAIAVDPATGDLLVADNGNLSVERFSATGAYRSSFNGADYPGGPFTSLSDLAIGTGGDIYVIANATPPSYPGGVVSEARVLKFTVAGEFTEAIADAASLEDARSLTVDSALGILFVATGGAANVFEFGRPATLYLVDAGSTTPIAFSGNTESAPVGLAIDSGSGRLYGLTDVSSAYVTGVTSVQIFGPVPSLSVEPPIDVTATSAHLSGVVNPNGRPSSAHFEYLGKGENVWKTTAEQSVGSGDTDQPISADIGGLAPNTVYRVRLVGTNDVATATSPVQEFSTLEAAPAVETGQATGRTLSGVTLRGTVNPNHSQSSYRFEYGLTSAYGSQAPAAYQAAAGNGSVPLRVAQDLGDLAPGTTYHYRLIAENSAGVGTGEDRIFTTVSASAPRRQFELVSPASKGGNNVEFEQGIQMGSSGEDAVFAATNPLTGTGGASAPLFVRYASQRTDEGWVTKAIDPPQNPNTFEALTFTAGVSDDGTRAVVLSTKKLAEGAVEGASNVYLRDLVTDRYTTIASVPGDSYYNAEVSTSNSVFVAGNVSFDQLLLYGRVPLIEGAPEQAIYRFSNGKLELASVAPDGTPIPSNSQFVWDRDLHLISEDGTRVFFVSQFNEGPIYVRLNGTETRVISASRRAADPGTVQAARFAGATADGHYAYLFSQNLTDDSPADVPSLYRYSVDDDTLKFLTRVSPNAVAYQGVASGDTLYFASPDNLTGDPIDEPLSTNIYAWRNGTLDRVATLGSSESFALWGVTAWRASPDGRYFVFASTTRLTDYDTASAACRDLLLGDSGLTCRQIYRYDAVTKTLSCASCPPDGGAATGNAFMGTSQVDTGGHAYPRAVTDQGLVFFDTPDQLVRRDVNSVRDVYEYDGDDIRLISRGTGDKSQFAGISADGRDVFFTSKDQLVGIDVDNAADLYDARIGGGIASQNPPPTREECIRDDCKATPRSGPELPFGGSEGLSGPQNLASPARKRCGKGRHPRKVRGHQRCIKRDTRKPKNRNRRQGR